MIYIKGQNSPNTKPTAVVKEHFSFQQKNVEVKIVKPVYHLSQVPKVLED